MSDFEDLMEENITIIREFIVDKVRMTGSDGVILGLSGGLDSATVLKLCVDALGAEKVHCLIMPESASPADDMVDARGLAERWNVPTDEVNIDKVVNSFPVDGGERLAFANLKARIRMCIQYYYANVENKLVVGTSNKSELLIGYTTKYGDSGADFLPVGDLYKTDIKKLAARIDVPKRFIEKTPRAGLWEGQTDEKELGFSYEELDTVLKGMEALEDVETITEKRDVPLDKVEEIKAMVERSAHKRKIPTILKLRNRTVGLDWREYSY
ncbi:MAG: NAD+ synthase [Thermoplasmata archaeon]